MNIPEYKSRGGLFLYETDLVVGHKQICIHNTNTAECKEYVKQLEEEGFLEYDSKEFSAGSDKAYFKNLFYTFTKDSTQIFVCCFSALQLVQLVVTEGLSLPSTKKIKCGEKKVLPTVTQCVLDKGMVYVVQACDGSFVLVDGDLCSESDSDKLYKFLTDKAGGEKPDVKAWFFTHPDSDHICLATDFISRYYEKVNISAFAYQFPELSKMQFAYGNTEEIRADINALENNIKKYYPNAVTYTLHTGQRYCFSGAEIEILLTADAIYPFRYLSANDISAVWRVNFEYGKNVLFLGDIMQYSCRQLAYIYGDYLKSDVLQVAHHGLIGGEIGLYKLIDPEICLWSTSEARFNGTLEGQRFQFCIGDGDCDFNSWLRDETVRRRTHYHLGKTATVTVC